MSEIAWEITSLSELGTFSRGKSKHRPRNDVKLFEGGKYPLVQTGDVKAANLYITKNDSYYNDFGLKQSKLWPAGTLCITIAANIAETAILSYPMCFPDSIVGFNANPEKSSELFVYYFFEYIKKEIQKSASGSIQDNINIDYLSKMRIKVPEKKYQDKIVELLSSIDKKILLNNQINQELEAMAKILYNYWFVQFDFPDQNGKPYKSSGGKMVYHPELKREIPEGWGVRKLNEVLDLISGYPFSSNDYVTSGKYKLYTIKNVQDGYTVDKVDNYLDFLPSNMSHECQLRRGDLIMSLTGNVGRVGMVYEDDVLLNQRVLKLNPINKTHKSFIYSFFRSDVTKAHLENMSTGTSQKNLSPIDIGNMMIPFPSESLLSKFLDNLNMLENNLVENQQLTKLRDWLLPMLMNGQVKVE